VLVDGKSFWKGEKAIEAYFWVGREMR
jgi:hypothetical protein